MSATRPDPARPTRTTPLRPIPEGFRPKKRLGQHFLVDRRVLSSFIRLAGLDGSQIVLEVGAGSGVLTAALADAAARVVAVEIDPGLVAACRRRLAGETNVQILPADVLTKTGDLAPAVVDALQSARKDMPSAPLHCVSDLPYCVATAVVSCLLRSPLGFERLTLMVQLEVARRLTAKPGASDYGALSVCSQLWARMELLRKVAPSAFRPRPEVDSALVGFDVDAHRAGRLLGIGSTEDPRRSELVKAFSAFEETCRALFHLRRKTLANNLKQWSKTQRDLPPGSDIPRLLKDWGFDPKARAQELPVERIADLFCKLQSMRGSDFRRKRANG